MVRVRGGTIFVSGKLKMGEEFKNPFESSHSVSFNNPNSFTHPHVFVHKSAYKHFDVAFIIHEYVCTKFNSKFMIKFRTDWTHIYPVALKFEVF